MHGPDSHGAARKGSLLDPAEQVQRQRDPEPLGRQLGAFDDLVQILNPVVHVDGRGLDPGPVQLACDLPEGLPGTPERNHDPLDLLCTGTPSQICVKTIRAWGGLRASACAKLL